ncbi:MAG: histidine ammonia-lyase [Planctomycetes bacterium RBG_16_59_8]|nr:MAG: histidine ammonia-lyase [Planctomycetes bacterium RBG_16_59_8]
MKAAGKRILIDGERLTLDDVALAATGRARLAVAPRAVGRIRKSRRFVEGAIRRGDTIYGITTGFGKLSDVRVSPEQALQLQRNVLVSHAGGFGNPLPPEEVRLMLLLRINSLAKGYSGVSIEMIDMLIRMFNADILPMIPEQSSVGASGDLTPLANIGFAMLGMGNVVFRGKKMKASAALQKASLRPYTFQIKEGLSLINGTQMMTALLGRVLVRLRDLLKLADVAAALSFEALQSSLTPFSPQIHRVRPHPGQAEVASNFRALMKESKILASHAHCSKVQDAYSIRCIPQVHGAVRDMRDHALAVYRREINSAVDNPLVFADDGLILSGGNFHGQPVAIVADALAAALTTLGNIIALRIDRLTTPEWSGLPAFLAKEGGVNSGLMSLEISSAAIAAENRTLAYPASVTTIPTCANKEDHVSMGPMAVRKLRTIADNIESLIAVEMICGAQGLEFHKPLRPGKGVAAATREVRRKVPPLAGDRYLKPDVDALRRLLRDGSILTAVERSVGKLC